MTMHTPCLKNVPPFACYNFDIRERILICFGTNTSNKVSNQKTLYYAISNNLCFCTTWQNGKTRKFHFSFKCNSSRYLISSIFFTHDSYSRCCMTSEILYQCVQLGAVVEAWFRRKEVKSAPAVGLCCTHNAPVRCLLDFLFRKVMLKH